MDQNGLPRGPVSRSVDSIVQSALDELDVYLEQARSRLPSVGWRPAAMIVQGALPDADDEDAGDDTGGEDNVELAEKLAESYK